MLCKCTANELKNINRNQPAEKKKVHIWPSQLPLSISAMPCCLWLDPHQTKRKTEHGQLWAKVIRYIALDNKKKNLKLQVEMLHTLKCV